MGSWCWPLVWVAVEELNESHHNMDMVNNLVLGLLHLSSLTATVYGLLVLAP